MDKAGSREWFSSRLRKIGVVGRKYASRRTDCNSSSDGTGRVWILL